MQMVGNLLTGFLMDRYGRKLTLVMSSVVVVIASAILSFAPSYPFLLLGSSEVRGSPPSPLTYATRRAPPRMPTTVAPSYAYESTYD